MPEFGWDGSPHDHTNWQWKDQFLYHVYTGGLCCTKRFKSLPHCEVSEVGQMMHWLVECFGRHVANNDDSKAFKARTGLSMALLSKYRVSPAT